MKNPDAMMEPLSPQSNTPNIASINESKSFFEKYFAPTSMKSAVFNFMASTIGVGILSFPFALRETGLLFGIILLAICTFFAYVSLNLLIMSSDFLSRNNKNILPSYMTLAMQCNGGKLATFTQINVILALVGSIVSRMVATGGTITILYEDYFYNYNTLKSLDQNTLYKFCIIGFSIIIIFPLSLLRNMSSLRFTSLFSVFCSLILTIVLVVEYFIQCDTYFDIHTCFWKQHHLTKVFSMDSYSNLVQFSWSGLVTAVPIFLFGYYCQANVFPIYLGLEDKTSSKMQKVFQLSLPVIAFLYFSAGSCGFLLFLNETCGNILLNDFNLSKKVMVSSIIFAVAMILAIPLFINVIRQNINDMIWQKKQVALTKHVIITFVILLFCILISIFVTDVSLVFGFIGSTTHPIIGYILPTYFFWKLMPKEYNQKYRKMKVLSLIMCTIIILISFGSIYYKIYTLATNTLPICDQSSQIEIIE